MFIKAQSSFVPPFPLPEPIILANGRHIVSDEQRTCMKILYEQHNLSTWKIGKFFGYKNVCVINNLKKMGVVLRNRSDANKTIAVNRSYFQQIDTHTKAYLLGLIYADGNVYKDSFTLALQSPDKPLLEKIATEIGYGGSLSFRKRQKINYQDVWALRVHDREFCDTLKKLGVVERKTSKVSFPYFLNPQFYWSFLHGLLDGDGCVSLCDNLTRFSGSITGSPIIIPQIAQFVKSAIGIHMYTQKRKNSNGWVCVVSSISALEVLSHIFKDSKNFCLKRKISRFLMAVNYYLQHNRFYKNAERIRKITNQYLNEASYSFAV